MDEVWMVPCGDRQDKVVEVDGASRYKMCELLLQELSKESVPIKVLFHQFINKNIKF